MLTSRNDRMHSGQKISVGVAHPKRYVLRRLVRGLTVKSAIAGGVLGFGYAVYAGGGQGTPLQMLLQTGVGALLGAAAGLTGSLAYAFIGGAPGAALGILGAGLIGSSSFAAFPTLAAMPRALTPEESGVSEAPLSTSADVSQISTDALDSLSTSTELGYIEPGKTGNAYTPVLSDDTIKEAAPPAAPLYKGPFNDRVVYLGMNLDSTLKATRQMSRHAQVTTISDDGAQDHVRNGNKIYDLRNQNGIRAFVASLGLNQTQEAGVRSALTMCEKNAKDELAGLAKIWAAGQKGAQIPSRLVLAGHSNGDGVWGDNNGSLRLGPLLELSRALPKATAQIEDAFVTGCYSGGPVTMDQYLLIFPRAKTIWAYDAQAPGVDNGATLDQAGWEEATRGRAHQTLNGPSASLGKHMAVWNYDSGYHAASGKLNLNDLRGKVQWMEEHFYQPALKGEAFAYDGEQRIPIRITDPHTGLIRQYYSWLVRLTQHKDLPEDERAFWNEKKNQAIRLLYFSDTVAPAFARNYAGEIARGYAKMGLKAPDYAHMDRAAALHEIASFNAKLQKNPDAPADSQQLGALLEHGLGDLDPSIVPDGWV